MNGDPDRSPVPRLSRRARHAYAGDASPFQPESARPLLERAIPVSSELSGYRPRKARGDLVAGITVAALALPSAMAYAEVAGLSPVHGLYALLLPTVAYALLGSARRLIVGPEGLISALVAVSVLALAAPQTGAAAELAATLALLVAACYTLALVLRLGWLADYLSRPVLVGYIHGVAIVLVIGQLGKLLGIDIDALDPVGQLVEVFRDIGDVSLPTLAVSAAALGALLPLRFVAPRFPAALVVVVAGIAASAGLDLRATAWRSSGRSPRACPISGCRRQRGATLRSSRRRRPACSWSASPTRSSPRGPTLSATASASASGRSCARWAPRTRRRASRRDLWWVRVARGRRSTTRRARAASSPG